MKTLKSIGAVLFAFIVIAVLSHLTDYILEHTGLIKLPFGSNPVWVIVLVILYRTFYVAMGGYIVSWLAPSKPMLHVTILASIGFVLGVAGAIAMWHEPPHWYPVMLVVLGVPATFIGGRLKLKNRIEVV